MKTSTWLKERDRLIDDASAAFASAHQASMFGDQRLAEHFYTEWRCAFGQGHLFSQAPAWQDESR